MKTTTKTAKYTIIIFAAALVLSMSMTTSIAAETYDLVILNGRVMDPETKLDAVRNVGVKDGKIVVITQDQIEGNTSPSDLE